MMIVDNSVSQYLAKIESDNKCIHCEREMIEPHDAKSVCNECYYGKQG